MFLGLIRENGLLNVWDRSLPYIGQLSSGPGPLQAGPGSANRSIRMITSRNFMFASLFITSGEHASQMRWTHLVLDSLVPVAEFGLATQFVPDSQQLTVDTADSPRFFWSDPRTR